MIRRFLKNQSGATAIEYGLIAALIAVVLVAALQAVGEAIDKGVSAADAAASSPAGGSLYTGDVPEKK